MKRKLANHELLAIIMGPGARDPVRLEKAKKLLRRHGLSGLTELNPDQWRAERVGRASATRLHAVFENESNELFKDIPQPRRDFVEIPEPVQLSAPHVGVGPSAYLRRTGVPE